MNNLSSFKNKQETEVYIVNGPEQVNVWASARSGVGITKSQGSNV